MAKMLTVTRRPTRDDLGLSAAFQAEAACREVIGFLGEQVDQVMANKVGRSEGLQNS